MKTAEQISKINAVVLYVLRNFTNGVDYIKLFKIIYFAQKDYLVSYGKVLCPDTFKARRYGPVPTLLDKVIKLVEENNSDWTGANNGLEKFGKSIRIDDKQYVYSLTEPDWDFLPKKEQDCLDRWYEYCKDKDSIQELSPKSHDSAYEKAYARSSQDPQLSMLTNMEIALAGYATQDMINYIKEKELIEEELS